MVTCRGHVKHSQNFMGKSLSHLRLSFGKLLKVLAYVHDFDVGLLCDACSLLDVFCFYRWLDDIIHGWIFVHKSVSIKVWITDVRLISKLYKSRPYLLSFPLVSELETRHDDRSYA